MKNARIVIFVLLGVILSSAGIDWKDWHLYAILSLASLNGVI